MTANEKQIEKGIYDISGAGKLILSDSALHVTGDVVGFLLKCTWGKPRGNYDGILSISEAKRLIEHLESAINSLDKSEKEIADNAYKNMNEILAKNHDFLSTEDWFEIAKIIDFEFTPCRDSFTATMRTCIVLTTNKCDDCSIVHCYQERGLITTIDRIGPDTQGWQEIHNATYYKIDNYLMSKGFHKTRVNQQTTKP